MISIRTSIYWAQKGCCFPKCNFPNKMQLGTLSFSYFKLPNSIDYRILLFYKLPVLRQEYVDFCICFEILIS